jgi:hypothetical protein
MKSQSQKKKKKKKKKNLNIFYNYNNGYGGFFTRIHVFLSGLLLLTFQRSSRVLDM